MKKTFLLFAFITLLIGTSCKEDPVPSKDIQLGAITALLPLDNLEQNNYAIFKNQYGAEIALELSVNKEDVQKTIASTPYQTENIEIKYLHPDDDNFSLSVTASAEYLNQNTYRKHIDCFYHYKDMQFPLMQPQISIGIDGELFGGVFHESDILLNEEFQNVYKNKALYPNTTVTQYYDVYYTPEWGVIGFETQDEELWVFDRFE